MGTTKKHTWANKYKVKVSRRASRGWGLRSCPRCGRAVRPRRAVPRCCAECSKRGPGGGGRSESAFWWRFGEAPPGLYRGAHIQAVTTLLEPRGPSDWGASSHRRPALPPPGRRVWPCCDERGTSRAARPHWWRRSRECRGPCSRVVSG